MELGRPGIPLRSIGNCRESCLVYLHQVLFNDQAVLCALDTRGTIWVMQKEIDDGWTSWMRMEMGAQKKPSSVLALYVALTENPELQRFSVSFKLRRDRHVEPRSSSRTAG